MSTIARLAVDLGDGALFATFLICVAFVAVYAATARWWQYESGRNVMALMVCLGATMGLAVLRLWYTGGLVFLWIRLGVFLFIPVVLAWRLWMLIRVQILDPSRDDETDDEKEDDDARAHP